jgi:ABC-2 type transport system ATP-binding protein
LPAQDALERMSLTGAGDNQVKTYSGGMRRRFDLAASLIGRPPVLFLDEPTTGLDPRTRNDLWQFIGDLVAEGTTVLLTTQYMEEAEHLAQAIVVLDAGRIAAQGTADELKDQLGGNVLEVQVTKRTDLGKAASLIAGLTSAPPSLDAALNRVTLPVKGGPRVLIATGRALDVQASSWRTWESGGPRSTTSSWRSPVTQPPRATTQARHRTHQRQASD